MKNHFISLFGTELKRTIIFFMTGVVLLSVALIVGITDNLPMIAMMLSGIIFFYFALLHPWKKASGFAILMGICLLIITIDFINPFINEGIAMSVGFVCFAGMITGIIGIFSRIKGWNKLPYSASLLSLVTLGMMITSIPNPGQ